MLVYMSLMSNEQILVGGCGWWCFRLCMRVVVFCMLKA
jgi:hypothetical protein